MGLESSLSTDQIEAALTAAHIAADEHYNLAHAEQWNTTFEFPQEAIDDDAALFQHCGRDFTLMCATKQRSLAHNRMSLRRIIETFGPTGTRYPTMLQSDFVTLTEFARHGITPPAAPDFVPQSVNIPPLRERYLKVKHTVNYLLYQQYLAKTMIILDTDVAKTIPGIHFSPQHQADSKGKPEGRVIGDLSGQHDAAYTPLNGTSASKVALRQVIADSWGEIKHPTIVQLVRMVLTAADIHGWQTITLWKKDLKGAFNLLNYNPEFCRLFAFPLSNNVTMIHLAGLFGWIGMPHAFQVLTRSLQAMCSHIISGLCHWYVDDLMAVSPQCTYTNDSERVDNAVQHLMGQGSIAPKKSEVDRKLEFLGWTIDLDARTITLCNRNLHKLIHALFSFGESDKVSVAHLQRIASLTSRAAILNRLMKPFTHELHTITSKYTQPHVRIQLTLLAQSDILMWRCFALILVANPRQLCRELESFRPTSPTYCFTYDASLWKVAVGLYSSTTGQMLSYAALALPFVVSNESRRQNTMEFIAIVFGLLLCWRLELTRFHYDLHGDSMSSLAWAKGDRTNSILARRSNIVFTTLSVHLDCQVATTEHVPGKLNIIMDGLSRDVDPSSLGLDPTLQYDAAQDKSIIQFLKLCDPDTSLADIHDHTALMNECNALLRP